MRLEHRIRRLEETGGRRRLFWPIVLPQTSLNELRRIEREIQPGDGLFIFNIGAPDPSKQSDPKVNDFLESIRDKAKSKA